MFAEAFVRSPTSFNAPYFSSPSLSIFFAVNVTAVVATSGYENLKTFLEVLTIP